MISVKMIMLLIYNHHLNNSLSSPIEVEGEGDNRLLREGGNRLLEE